MTNKDLIKYRQTQVLYDRKWHNFLKYAWVFKYIPFIDGVFGNGSMAIGNVSNKSDFDVLILSREKRIFTARAFGIVFFGLLGVRRSKNDYGIQAADKVCLNHFISPDTFHLSEEPNGFWQLLYEKLVPVYGTNQIFQDFFNTNSDWLEPRTLFLDSRHKYSSPNLFKKILEAILSRGFGSFIEKKLKKIQVYRIEKGLKAEGGKVVSARVIIHNKNIADASYSLPPLIKYNDRELQFHPDSATIEIRHI